MTANVKPHSPEMVNQPKNTIVKKESVMISVNKPCMGMSKMKNTLLPALAAAICLITTASAQQPVIYESFDYATGSNIAGQTADFGINAWGTGGTVSLDQGGNLVGASGGAFGILPTKGNAINPVSLNAYAYNADITATGFSSFVEDGDTLWMSMLVTVESGGAAFHHVHFGIGTDAMRTRDNRAGALTSIVSDGITFGVDGIGRDTIETFDGTAGTVTSTNVANGLGTRLMVAELIFGATDTVNLYAVDSSLTLPGTPVQSQTGLTLDNANFDTIYFGGQRAESFIADELRVGATFNDVTGVPEPSTLALVGLAAFGFCSRRRRR